MRKSIKWIGIIFVGLLIIGTITSKEIKEPKDKSVTAFKQGEEKYKIGDVVTMGDLEYKVEEVFQAKELENENLRDLQNEGLTEYLKDRPGKHFQPESVFLIVKITVTNRGKEDRDIYASMFKLAENDGTEYDIDIGAGVYIEGNQDFFPSYINPKLSKTGYVVFDLPTLESSYALKVSGGHFSAKEEKLIYLANEEIIEYSK